MNNTLPSTPQSQTVAVAIGGYGELMSRETYRALPPALRDSVRWIGLDVDDTANDLAPHLPQFLSFGTKLTLAGSRVRHLLAKMRAEGIDALPDFPVLVRSVQALDETQISRVYGALDKQRGAGQIRAVGAAAIAANLGQILRLLDDNFTAARKKQTANGKLNLVFFTGSSGAVGSGGTPLLASWLTQQLGYQDVEVSVIIGCPRHLLRYALRESFAQQESALAANARAMLEECEGLTHSAADTRAAFDRVYLIDAQNDAGTPLAGLPEHTGLCGAFGAALFGGLGAYLAGTTHTNEDAAPGTVIAVGCATISIPPELEDHAESSAKASLIDALLRSTSVEGMTVSLPPVPPLGDALPLLAQDKEGLKAIMADPIALENTLGTTRQQIEAELTKVTSGLTSCLASYEQQSRGNLTAFALNGLHSGLPTVRASLGTLKEGLLRRKDRRQRDREIAQKSRDLLAVGAQRALTSPSSWFASRARLQVRHFEQWRAACDAWRSAQWDVLVIDRALMVVDAIDQQLGQIEQAATSARVVAEAEIVRARAIPITARLIAALRPELWPVCPADKIAVPDYASTESLAWPGLEAALKASARQAVQALMADLSLAKISHPSDLDGQLKSGSTVLARRKAGIQHELLDENYLVGEQTGVSRGGEVTKTLAQETGCRLTWVQLLRGLKASSLLRMRAEERAYDERHRYLHVVSTGGQSEQVVTLVETAHPHRRTG